MGSVTNRTSAGVHHDQAAGYYNGGGFSVRNRAKNTQLGAVQLPNFKAGCGGIDMFTGGFSFVSSAELVNALKSIGSSAVSYGFMLAMKTFAPAVQSVMAELQDMATKINQANINSCETAATLLGGVWPKSDLTSRHICPSMGSHGGVFKDWAAARQGCGAGSKHREIMSHQETKESYKNILAEEFNIAWEVIKRNNYLISDPELAEMCMTISGTIIAYTDEENRKIVTYPSKADNDDLVKSLFEGGTTQIYGCNETMKCLRISSKNLSIKSDNGFINRIKKTLDAISEKAIKDEPLDEKEIAFIGKILLPIYKMINVLNAYKRTEFDLRNFTDIICVDLIHEYITEILDVMLEEASNLRNVQVSDEEISKFVKQLRDAKANINRKRQLAYQQMNNMLIVIESAKIYEKKLENTFNVMQKGEQ